MRHVLALAVVIGSMFSTASPAATDAACKPIIEADKARAASQAWHTRKMFDGSSIELIRLGDDIYGNMRGSGWKKMPPEMAKNIANAGNQAENFDISECKKIGEENVGGVATTLYSFKTTMKGQPPFSGKVWIGNKDGLPYREAGDKLEGLTTYEGVSAPPLK